MREAISQADLDDYRWERQRQQDELEDITGGHPDDIEDYFARGGKPLVTFKDWISGRPGGDAEREAWEGSDLANAPSSPEDFAGWGDDRDTPPWALDESLWRGGP